MLWYIVNKNIYILRVPLITYLNVPLKTFRVIWSLPVSFLIGNISDFSFNQTFYQCPNMGRKIVYQFKCFNHKWTYCHTWLIRLPVISLKLIPRSCPCQNSSNAKQQENIWNRHFWHFLTAIAIRHDERTTL